MFSTFLIEKIFFYFRGFSYDLEISKCCQNTHWARTERRLARPKPGWPARVTSLALSFPARFYSSDWTIQFLIFLMYILFGWIYRFLYIRLQILTGFTDFEKMGIWPLCGPLPPPQSTGNDVYSSHIDTTDLQLFNASGF